MLSDGGASERERGWALLNQIVTLTGKPLVDYLHLQPSPPTEYEEMLGLFQRITDPSLRQAVLFLIRDIADRFP